MTSDNKTKYSDHNIPETTKVLTVENSESEIEYFISVYNELVEKDTKLDMNGSER